MFKGTPITILGTILAVGALAAWAYTAPAAGSGWILFVAFVGSMSLLNTLAEASSKTAAAIAGIVITVAAVATWFTHQGFEHVWAVGLLAILAGLGTFTSVTQAVKDENAKKKD